MTLLRPAELAGTHYPADAPTCRAQLSSWCQDQHLAPNVGRPWGAWVPHAGWDVTGPLAARTLAAVARERPQADLVAVLGGHLQARDKPRVFIEGGFETPLGPLPVAEDPSQQMAMLLDAEPETPEEYYDDNAIEVLAPMIRYLWPNARLMALALPPDEQASKFGPTLADVMGQHAAHPLVVASADLTHYGVDHRFRPQGWGPDTEPWARRTNDAELVELARSLRGSRVVATARKDRSTCAAGSLAAALTAAKTLGARRTVVDAHTSSLQLCPDPERRSFVTYVGARIVE